MGRTESFSANKKVWIRSTDPVFTYEGRIDFENPEAPTFVYACSYFRFRLGGNWGALAVENRHSYFENSLGVLVDGDYRGKILLHDGSRPQGETTDEYLLRMDLRSFKILDRRVEFFLLVVLAHESLHDAHRDQILLHGGVHVVRLAEHSHEARMAHPDQHDHGHNEEGYGEYEYPRKARVDIECHYRREYHHHWRAHEEFADL